MAERTVVERHQAVKELFAKAIELGPEAAAWLKREVTDPALVEEVLSLLRHHDDRPLIDEAPRPPPPPPRSGGDVLGLVGVTLDGRYRVDAFVAEGGFGYVYRAEQLLWRRPVAVKVFKPVEGLDVQDSLREAFVKEGAVLNALSRKTTAIVQSYDVGVWTPPTGPSLLFTVLEWLEGRSLADVLGRPPREPWPLARVMETLGPVAEALAVAHASGVAHRDVKPRNIFVVEEAGARTVKLLDFGAAKLAADHKDGFLGTGNGITALTMSYAAPEQLHRRQTSGPWSDVYTMGIVILELLLGRHPMDAGLIGEGGAGSLGKLAKLGVSLEPQVIAVLQRAMAADPFQRPKDAGALWAELTEATRPKKPAKRRWWPWGQ